MFKSISGVIQERQLAAVRRMMIAYMRRSSSNPKPTVRTVSSEYILRRGEEAPWPSVVDNCTVFSSSAFTLTLESHLRFDGDVGLHFTFELPHATKAPETIRRIVIPLLEKMKVSQVDFWMCEDEVGKALLYSSLPGPNGVSIAELDSLLDLITCHDMPLESSLGRTLELFVTSFNATIDCTEYRAQLVEAVVRYRFEAALAAAGPLAGRKRS
ncbi:MAG: hypothetical protein WCO52_05020 [bacterium]